MHSHVMEVEDGKPDHGFQWPTSYICVNSVEVEKAAGKGRKEIKSYQCLCSLWSIIYGSVTMHAHL